MVCSVFFSVLLALDLYGDIPIVGSFLGILFNIVIGIADNFVGCSF